MVIELFKIFHAGRLLIRYIIGYHTELGGHVCIVFQYVPTKSWFCCLDLISPMCKSLLFSINEWNE
eukprot:c46972_g1_i1 orf=1-198(+)